MILLLLVTTWFAAWVVYPAAGALTHGFGAYYTASRLVQTGQISADIYNPAYFRPLVEADTQQQASDIYNANPPTTALMLWPLSYLPVEQARFFWIVASGLMLWGGLALLGWTFANPPRLTLIVLLLSIGMLFQPVIDNFRFGQAYLFIFLLLTTAIVTWKKQQAKLGGLVLALALLLKTAGVMLLPLLAWQRHWQFLAWTVGIAGGLVLLTLPLFPISMWQAYVQLLIETANAPSVCVTTYQTTRSLLCHLFMFDGVWNPAPIAHLPWLARFLFAGLALSSLAACFILNRFNQLAALLSVIAWGVLFAPLGEQYHHTVMLVPISWLVIEWPTLNNIAKIFTVIAILGYLIPLHIGNPRFEAGGWAIFAYPRLYSGWLVLLALFSLIKRPSGNTFNRHS